MDPILVLICKDMNGVVPEEIQVIPYGTDIKTPKGNFTLDEECAPLVLAEYQKQVNQMVIDYEHQTLMGTKAPAAGWITKLIDKGTEGIWAAVEWTAKARAYIANKEYKYVSPVFLVRLADHRVIRLINVALTNQPNIDGMVPLVNKAGEYKFATQKEEKIMWKELLKKLGLAETATEADAIAAINKMETAAAAGKGAVVVANKSVLTALGLAETATESEVTGTIMAMKQSHTQVGDLATQVKTLQDKLSAGAAADAVALAMKDGKITPAQKEWADKYAATDLAGFKVFVAKAPTVVVMGKVVGDEKPAEGALDEVQIAVNKQMGIDTETFKKYNQ
jgi:phage I-like protein